MAELFERPGKAPELLKLDRFSGKWVSWDTHRPMPWMKEGGAGSSREFFRKACGGYCYLTDIEAETPFGGLIGHGFLFYETQIEKYRLLSYSIRIK